MYINSETAHFYKHKHLSGYLTCLQFKKGISARCLNTLQLFGYFITFVYQIS